VGQESIPITLVW